MRESLNAEVVRDWANVALAALGEARAEIDALNVFPVPDGDTGTNLFLTMEAAAAAVNEAAAATVEVDVVAKAFANGALMGARGNSGVITSQLLRGFSEVLGRHAHDPVIGGRALADALARASELAYSAVGHPIEGTILSVAAAAAGAVAGTAPGQKLADVARIALKSAAEALSKTTEQLEALRVAGVVDSGGKGYVVILEALAEVVTGIHVQREKAKLLAHAPITEHTLTYGGPEYEVMFLLEADDDQIPELRRKLADLGNSLVVVGGDRLWNVHVHVDDVGAAVEAGVEAGRPYRIRVTRLEQAETLRQSGQAGEGSAHLSGRAVVAVAHGPGIADLLESSGVTVVRSAPLGRPSTAELLDGIKRAAAREVVVLPSDKDTRSVAEAAASAARDQGVRAAVIPTRSVVQTLAAVAVHEDGARFDDDVVAMGRAAGATRYGAVTIAAKRAWTSAGICQIGDVLGLVDGDIVEIGDDVAATTIRVLDRMLGAGGELVTIVAGQEADEALLAAVEAAVRDDRPGIDVDVISGGQPNWPLILGVE